MTELAKTKYTGNYLNFLADESLIILLGLAEVPSKVIALYKMIQHPAANENERQNALRQVEALGYGETKILEIKRIYQAIIERKSTKAETKTVAKTTKPKVKKAKKAKRENCSGCGNKANHKLPHNYGGTRRFIHLCDTCLPQVAPIIGHRLTHKPIWRD
jgi:Na+-transporting NADH:ubiquinone oxidoreductase subunit NqrC